MIDFKRLEYLNKRISSNTSTQAENDEYMALLYKNGSITQNQYSKYLKDKSAENILSTAITIGGIILLGYLINELAKKE